MLEALRTLYSRITPMRRRQLFATFLLMLIGAVAEIVTVGAVVPFLALVADPRSSLVPVELYELFAGVGVTPVIGAAALLAVAAIVATGIRLLLAWTTQRFVMALGHDIALMVFSESLRQPYAVQVRRNSSQTLAAIEKAQGVVFGVLQPAMQGLLAAVLAFAITIFVVWMSPAAAGLAALVVVLAYLIVTLVTRPLLKRNSEAHAETIVQRTRTVQEGLGGIRDIILDRSQPLIEARFAELDLRHRLAQARNQFMSIAPRYVVEAGGLMAFAAVTVMLSLRPGGLVGAIPLLGALALGAQRMLPMIHQVYHGWSQMLGNHRAFLDIVRTIEAPLPTIEPAPASALAFARRIEFRDVGFRYEGGSFALQGVNFTIAAGEHVGFAGITGSGKSTLLDLLMGLLEPSEGQILVDDRALQPPDQSAWQAVLSHVPQSIYLIDGSIAANVCFPRPVAELDEARLAEAIELAELGAFVATLPEGLATEVGERGVRLSGGQRQRIGLARALYRRPQLLILDEATSALDDATEAAILASLHRIRSGLTLVTVAHRSSSLAACDRVITVQAGRVLS